MSDKDKTRINRVITRTGDRGDTGLADGSRVSKWHPRIQVLGELDELNSALGVLRARSLDTDLDTVLGLAQQLLFDIGGELASWRSPVAGSSTITIWWSWNPGRIPSMRSCRR